MKVCWVGCICERCVAGGHRAAFGPQIGTPAVVTREMVSAAQAYVDPLPLRFDRSIDIEDDDYFTEIYRAMHAAAPVLLVSEAEDRHWNALVNQPEYEGLIYKERKYLSRIAQLEAENATLRATNAQCVTKVCHDALIGGSIARTWLQDNNLEGAVKTAGWEYAIWDDCYHPSHPKQDSEIVMLRAALAAKDARIAALDTELATRPAVPETPNPASNPFREFGGDRRKIGG